MRNIDRIVLHCSATPEGKDYSVETIRDWHVNGRGWSDIGYHYVIRLDGSVELGRPIDKIGAHVKGHNKTTVGVCYIGGCDEDMQPKDTMTEEQACAFEEVVNSVRCLFGKDITIHGHNEYSSKACPSFVVQEKFSYLDS
tara:strand:- start:89 stop:508 length:420 start_codon:yes stop_codon:yes gene_type:complete